MNSTENSTTRQLRSVLYEPPTETKTMTTAEFNEAFDAVSDWWVMDGKAKVGKYQTYKCRLMRQYEKASKIAEVLTPEREGPVTGQQATEFLSARSGRKRAIAAGIKCKAKFRVLIEGDVATKKPINGATPHEGHDIADHRNKKLPKLAQMELEETVSNMKYVPGPIIAKAIPKIISDKGTPSKKNELKTHLISTKTVANAKRKLYLNQDISQRAVPVADDVAATVQFILEQGYKCDTKLHERGTTITFASEFGIQTLADNTFLLQLDSTHCTNEKDWKLCTLYVRTKWGSWIPGAQMLLSVENSDTVSQGL